MKRALTRKGVQALEKRTAIRSGPPGSRAGANAWSAIPLGPSGVSPLRGGRFAASFGRKSYGAAATAYGAPGDRPPAVPAVSRCHARQHHDQTDNARAESAGSREDVAAGGRNAAHCPGEPLQPQTVLRSRCAGRTCGAPLTLETSASPAGPTARASPYVRAANLRQAAYIVIGADVSRTSPS